MTCVNLAERHNIRFQDIHLALQGHHAEQQQNTACRVPTFLGAVDSEFSGQPDHPLLTLDRFLYDLIGRHLVQLWRAERHAA